MGTGVFWEGGGVTSAAKDSEQPAQIPARKIKVNTWNAILYRGGRYE